MTTLTKQQARELGLKPFTNVFRKFEHGLLDRMFAEISINHPGAAIVERECGMRQIWTPKVKAKNPDKIYSPKALRGHYPTVRQIVGQAI